MSHEIRLVTREGAEITHPEATGWRLGDGHFEISNIDGTWDLYFLEVLASIHGPILEPEAEEEIGSAELQANRRQP